MCYSEIGTRCENLNILVFEKGERDVHTYTVIFVEICFWKGMIADNLF